MRARKDRLFSRLAGFLRRNAGIVADARDSNEPWRLLQELDNFEDAEVEAEIARLEGGIEDGQARWSERGTARR
jgi:hypothetical protein